MALKVGELFATLNLKDEGFSSGIGKFGKMFTGITAGITTAATAAGTAALKSIVKTGSSFEASMSEVQAISGATGAELEMLTNTAKEYGATTAFTASEAADALKYMALAGWNAEQSAAALPGVLNLAAASGMELGTASDYVTDYISAFGMECSQASYLADLMAKAQATSNTSAMQLGEAYKNCASNMHAAGQDVETTTSMLMTMANQGLKGSEAGTALAAIMRDITQKMDDGAIKIGKTSVAVQDAQGNFRDLTDIMFDVQNATAGMGSAEKSAALLATFTARSIKGVNMILNEGAGAAADYETSLRGATGTAADQASTMLDNLKGDITIFQSALEGLQIDAYESMNGMMREGVQGATGLVQQLQAAFQEGMTPTALEGVLDSAFDLLGNFGGKAGDMIANITEAFASAAPKIAKGLSSGLSNVLGKVGKQMPKLAKNLFSALPDVLGAAGDLLPNLADSLFETLGGVIEQVISDLPRLVPALIEGLVNLFKSAVSGVFTLANSLLSGVWNLLGDLGIREWSPQELLEQKLAEVDMDRVKELSSNLITYDFDADADVDVSGVQEAVSTAMKTIHDTLIGSGLSEEDTSAIEEAIRKGSGVDALTAAFESLEIPDASGVATQISTAMNTISSALSSTNLSTEAQQKAIAIGLAGGNVEQALIDMGVDPGVASQAAEQITSAIGSIKGALDGYDIDTNSLITNATTDKGEIVAALELLGLKGEDIDAILGNLEKVSGTLTAQYSGIFEELGNALTNGVPDENDPALAAAKEKIQGYFQTVYETINGWKEQKLQELNESGLTGESYDSALSDINQTVAEWQSTAENLENSYNTWLSENAGQATDVVKSHLGELQELMGQADALNAQIDMMAGKFQATSGGNVNRKAVEQGLVEDQQGQIEAINYTAQELDYALKAANAKAATALEEAAAKYGNNTEAYAKKRKEIMEQLSKDESDAYSNYDSQMGKIVQGMIKSDPRLAEALVPFAEDSRVRTQMQKLASGMQKTMEEAGKTGEPIDMNKFWESMNISEADMSSIAEHLGVTPENLKLGIEQEMKGLGDAGMFSRLSEFGSMLNNDLAELIGSGAVDISDINEVFSSAIENGLMLDDGSIDWSKPEAALIAALGAWYSYAGEETESLAEENTLESEPTLDTNVTPGDSNVGEIAGQTIEEAQETVNNTPPIEGEAEANIDLETNVETPPDTGEQITEVVEESTQGAGGTTTIEPEVEVKPEVKPAEGTQEQIAEATGEVEGEQAPPVEMKMDVNASIGNVTFTEGGSIADRLTALFTEQSIPLAVNIEASVGSVTFAEGSGIEEQLTALVTEQNIPLGVNIDASIGSISFAEGSGIEEQLRALVTDQNIPLTVNVTATVGTVTLAEGASLQTSLATLMPAEALSVNVSVAATLSLSSVTLSEGTSLQSAVDSLLASQALSVALTASATLTISLTSSNARSVGQTEGAALSSGVSSGISSGSGGVQAAAASMMNSAASSLRSASSAAQSAGRAFASGLASGISAGRSAVISAAASIAQAAAAAARSALAIHSPSRVTREIGTYFDIGMANGIVGAMNTPIRAATDMANQLADAVTVRRLAPSVAWNGARTTGGSAQPIDYDRLADAMNQRQMVLTMDNRRLAQVQERETARAQTLRNRKLALGYGK